MTLQDLMVAVEKVDLGDNFSNGMAVPKKRRSKAKGKIRLSNWKKKAKTAAIKAYNAAKPFFAKEKAVAIKDLNLKKNEEQITEEVVNIDASIDD